MVKNAFWNALSLIVFMSIIGVIAFFTLIFLNPYTNLNPFPPPTLPAALNLPTFTPTYAQFPATWTPGVSDQQGGQPNLLPSSTPLASPTMVVLNHTSVPIYVATHTRTPTVTQTNTPKPTRTKTPIPNLTATYMAQVATNAAQTAVAGTATANALGPWGTQTIEAMPSNPSSANETHGASNDTWQDLVSDPAFSWLAPSGATGYYVYWGSEAGGTSTTTISSPSYNPPALTTGIYYLRLRTIFSYGARPDWTTVFIFRYDGIDPNPPVSASETNGASSGEWGAVGDPAFTWSGASDSGSGVTRYDVYFGSNPNGTYVVATPSSASYDPSAITTGTYYLRVRSLDAAGNASDWVTLFVLKYDGTAPGVPGSLQTADPGTDSTPTFTWSGSSDADSGFAAYELFWDAGTSCGSKNQDDQTGTSFTAPEISSAGDYIFCVRARDNVGNTSGWAQQTFTYSP